MNRVRIAGIGNVLMGDDGIGPFAIKILESHYDFPDGVEILDLGTPGLDLPIYLSGTDAVILVDSAQFSGDPGEIRLFGKGDVMQNAPASRIDPHSPALKESIFLVEQTGEMSVDFLLIGVQGACFNLGEGLSTPVRETVPRVIDAVIAELHRLNVWCCPAVRARQSDIWWDPVFDKKGDRLCNLCDSESV